MTIQRGISLSACCESVNFTPQTIRWLDVKLNQSLRLHWHFDL